MPAVQCLRGMNSPANGIFFRRRAALMLGRRRQETRCGRPRALLPPFPPEGAARRGGSKDREQSKGATGRTALMRVGSARADGRSLRGSGSVFEQRQDVMRRKTAAGEGCPGLAAGTDCRYRRRLRLHSMVGKWRRRARQCRAGGRRAGPSVGARIRRVVGGRSGACRHCTGKNGVGIPRFDPAGASSVRKTQRIQPPASISGRREPGVPGAVRCTITVVIVHQFAD